jgi:thiamine-monophosphate kinase
VRRSIVHLSDLGELGLLAELERRGLVAGIEHDAAAFGDGLVVTQDSLVEDVHFRLDWLSWRDLGFRAAAVSISDLAASAARPEALIVSLGAPAATRADDVLELYAGLAEAEVPIRGGDTTEAASVFLTVTALGRTERVPGRTGAKAGDAIIVTGALGGAGAAFRHHRYVRPPLRVDEGIRLGAAAHAMLDLSDGLAQDVGHVARRSGCRVVIDLERVPLAPGASIDDLGFGEDYELLAATPDPLAFAVIGRCEEGEGVDLRLQGQSVELGGWSHFGRAS